MNRSLVLALALALAPSSMVFAQDMGAAQTVKAAPLKTVKGTVKVDGDKTWFVADADKKAWEVMNPEALKGHEGHHVQVSAHVYANKSAIHVMDAKMLK
jgi:hypothetical protein